MKFLFCPLYAAVFLTCVAAGPATQPASIAFDVNPALPAIPDRTFNFADYGAVGDGKTMNTEAFHKAVDAVHAAGGGRLVVPPGNYLTMPFVLTSHMDLHLDKGATILASNKFSDFGLPDPSTATQAVVGTFKKKLTPLIGGRDLTDVALTGEGTIDGSGAIWWAWSEKAARGKPGRIIYPRPKMVVLDNITRLHVQGITLTNSPSFHLVPHHCQDVLVEGIRVIAPGDSPNTDGIDPSASHNVLIRNCYIDNGDDNISFKGGSGLVENVLVTDCTCMHGHGISVGSDTQGGIRNILVQRCTFEGTHPAIRIKSARDRGGVIENITYTDITMKNVGTAITLNLFYEDKLGAKSREQRPVTRTTPIVRNIVIRNVTVSGAKLAGEMIGLPEMPLSHILLDNVQITADTGMNIQDGSDIELKNVSIMPKSGQPWTANHADVQASP
jgi:polygalacturonase